MSTLPPSFVHLMENGTEAQREFLRNVQPVGLVREPETLPAEVLDDLCWIWQGSATREGYAKHPSGGYIQTRAHEVLTGPVPPGMIVQHGCGNRLCVNPRHLQAVTRSQAASRRANRDTRLTPEQLEEIRNALASGAPQTEIALKFGISQAHVSAIKNKKAWNGLRATPEQLTEAEEHPAQGLNAWLNLQVGRLGPIGQLARGETMPGAARERALSKATKEYMTYQLLSREYEARRSR